MSIFDHFKRIRKGLQDFREGFNIGYKKQDEAIRRERQKTTYPSNSLPIEKQPMPEIAKGETVDSIKQSSHYTDMVKGHRTVAIDSQKSF